MRRALLLTLLGTALVQAACATGEPRVVVAGEEGGDPAAQALATVLRERAQLQASAEVAGNAVELLGRLREGRVQLAFTTADVLADAVNGQGAFRGQTVPARTIATLSDAPLHLVVLQQDSINGLSSLRGRRVSTGPAGSATELTALRVLREALLRPERDLERVSLGLPDAMTALFERRIDAFFWIGALPIPLLEQALSVGAPRIRLVSTASVVPLLQKRFGESLYLTMEVPASAYNSGEPAALVATGQVLVTGDGLPDATAFLVAKALVDASTVLAGAHPLFRGLPSPRGARSSPAALHPGAARYLRETRP